MPELYLNPLELYIKSSELYIKPISVYPLEDWPPGPPQTLGRPQVKHPQIPCVSSACAPRMVWSVHPNDASNLSRIARRSWGWEAGWSSTLSPIWSHTRRPCLTPEKQRAWISSLPLWLLLSFASTVVGWDDTSVCSFQDPFLPSHILTMSS